MKAFETWHSDRVRQDMRLVRWGAFGVPVVLFPTAGGDAEEAERMGLIDSVAPLLAAGRVKVYSLDSVAGRSWLERRDPLHSAWLQNQYDQAIRWEVVPAIRLDCQDDSIEMVAAGASFGAFNALEVLCRHADVFRAAVGMSGTYDLQPWMMGQWSDDFYYSSPLHYLPDLAGGYQLDWLRSRFAILATGTGSHEDADQSWRAGQVLGSRGVPNRVDFWYEWAHDWPTWREMLPRYLDELVP